jgi:hypothetical protein
MVSPGVTALLTDTLQKVLAALVAHDFARLPLTADARYTENGQTLSFGDGLWGTLTGYAGQPRNSDAKAAAVEPARFRIDFVDEARSEAVFFGATVETTTRGMLVLRIRMRGEQIAEIEAIAVRVETPGERGGTVALFQPPLLTQLAADAFDDVEPALIAAASQSGAGTRDALTAIADSYFSALQSGNSGKVPFAATCRRRDNGVQVTGNPEAAPLDPAVPAYRPFALGCAAQIDSGFFSNVARIRGVRHLAVDASRGLVLTVALLDQPGDVDSIVVNGVGRISFPAGATADELATTEGTPQFYVKRHEPNFRVPLTQITVQLTRIEEGKIVQMESISRAAPYGVNTGWEP